MQVYACVPCAILPTYLPAYRNRYLGILKSDHPPAQLSGSQNSQHKSLIRPS